MTITNITDREIALQARVAELEQEQAVFLGQKDWLMKSHNQACDARDALQERVSALEAIEKQLSDNVVWQAGEIAKHLATIEASRKQVPCAFTNASWLSNPHAGHFSAVKTDCFNVPLFAAPVVAPDVLKEIERKNEALLNIARKAEALKKECGDDPESPQAIRNGQYMQLSYLARAAMGGAND